MTRVIELRVFLKPMSKDDRAAFAQRCGTTWGHLKNVDYSGKTYGPALAVSVEAQSGGAVRRWDMRPDDRCRIWPELVNVEGAPPIPTLEARNAF